MELNTKFSVKNYFMSNTEIKKEVLIFSAPLIAENMLMSLISVVNSSMVGHLGRTALAAVGLTNQPVFIFTAVFQSFNVGATALIARFIGSKDYKDVKNVMHQTLMVSTLLGLIIAVLGFVYSEALVRLMGAQEDTLEAATMYMRYMSIGAFFQAIPLAIASILRGAGKSRPPMVYNTVANVVNVMIGYLLINGIWVFPKLGLEGAAIGATIAKAVACMMSIVILFMSKPPVEISIKDQIKVDFKMLKRIMDISISAAGEQFIMRMGFLIYTKTIAELGTVSLASHQVISNITGLVSNVVGGFAIAASSYTGRCLGAKDATLARVYVDEIKKIGFIFSLSVGILFVVFGYQLGKIFTPDEEVLILVQQVLIIGGLITFPQNTQQILSGSLRGAGDTKWPLVTALVTVTVCRVGLAIVFVKVFHLGLMGAWMAALFDQSLRAIFTSIRYKSGKWALREV
jgi:putative MATE family efflux protein